MSDETTRARLFDVLSRVFLEWAATLPKQGEAGWSHSAGVALIQKLTESALNAHAETVARLEQRAAMAEMMLAQKQQLTRGIDRALRAAGFNYGENVTIRDGETIAAALIDRLAAERDALTAENATLKEALAQWERDYSDYGRAAPDGKRDPMSDQTERRYREALQHIVNTVAALHREADANGMRFNGLAAVLLSNDANYLRSVARDALKSRPPKKRRSK